jgi:tRNA U38,U39,U40 pseudouridine synthase TruA
MAPGEPTRRPCVGQVAHLELYTDLPPEMLRRKLNDELPRHSRPRDPCRAAQISRATDAVARCYLTRLPAATAFGKNVVWWIREPIDVEAMRAARSPSLA